MSAQFLNDLSDDEKREIAANGVSLENALEELIAELVREHNPVTLQALPNNLQGVPLDMIFEALRRLHNRGQIAFTSTRRQIAIWPAEQPTQPSPLPASWKGR